MQASGKGELTMVSSKGSEKEPWKRHPRGYAWIAVLIILASLATTGAVSAATPITGPITITVPGDYYLANSIINSTAGIIIAVPNVVLDGKGKIIDGVDKSGTYGIRVFNSAMTLFNVVIKNVVITDWNDGIWMSDTKNSQIDKVTSSSNLFSGIALQNSMRNTITNSILKDNVAVGIVLYEQSNSNTLTGNTASRNGIDGIRLRYSNNNDLVNNKLLDNKGPGINFDEAANYNTVTGNTITGNTGHGIYLSNSNSNIITKNTLKYNRNGIWIAANCVNNEIAQNTVQNSTYDGIVILSNSDNNVVSANTFEKNSEAGIWLYNNNRNTIYNNLVKNNVQFGIHMETTGSNVIVNNYFYNNKNSVLISGLPANQWNLPQSTQKSITGGANSGGNSWGQPNGQGFSQITPATNGICNKPYSLATNNIDNLPLKWASK